MNWEGEAEIESVVREVMGALFGRPVPAGEPISQGSEPLWDSLRHVELLLSLEGVFKVRFDQEELAALTSLERLVGSVRRHLAT